MAHLWRSSGVGAWEPVALEGNALALDGAASLRPPGDGDAGGAGQAAILVRCAGDRAADIWALLARPGAGVAVNGLPVDLGMVVLADRDAIGWPLAAPVFFSTERLAAAEPFPADARGFCPRCKDPMEAGATAVRCPGCGVWHHAAGERPCWTYGPQCAACPQPTALDGGFRWTPEEL